MTEVTVVQDLLAKQLHGMTAVMTKRFFLLLLLLLISVVAPVVSETATPIVGGDGDTEETEPENAQEQQLPTTAVTIVSIDVEIPKAATETAQKDKHENCQEWAKTGECEANPTFMLETCAVSCGVATTPTTTTTVTAYVLDGEDAAIGAFRFAEENYIVDEAELVLQVAQQLRDRLDDAASSYEPPQELTHCSAAGNKSRVCSAGKLWKRAEEMKSADMYDAAGADLLRALLKTGIEIDFIAKCKRSLEWSFQSISRQRERERRDAIEEEKLEKRRQEEAEAMEEAARRRQVYEDDFVKFGVTVQDTLASPPPEHGATASVETDGTVETEDNEESVKLNREVMETFVQEGPQGGQCEEAVQLLKKLALGQKTIDVLLIEARCHELLGNHKKAMSAAGSLIHKAADHNPWVNSSPRMMAATLGANSAMQLGESKSALSFYQTVLKFDPEQPLAREQYRGLKKVVKLMKKADDEIEKGYNKKAAVHVDDCLSAMRGLDVDSPLFRSSIQLKLCTIMSAMGKYEEALDNCDTAVDLRLANDSVSAASRKEAHLTRAEALLLDMDYDEAVQDFRAALELVSDFDQTGEKRELEQKLRQTMHQQDMWNGGKKDHRFNENTGYPDGMPPQRDHAKILQLPIDLEHREKSVKCAWLKKQFKALVRKYHPDKYKGNKKRAARKFKEVKEAKEIISKEWSCK